jgi:hypothetical protein
MTLGSKAYGDLTDDELLELGNQPMLIRRKRQVTEQGVAREELYEEVVLISGYQEGTTGSLGLTRRVTLPDERIEEPFNFQWKVLAPGSWDSIEQTAFTFDVDGLLAQREQQEETMRAMQEDQAAQRLGIQPGAANRQQRRQIGRT